MGQRASILDSIRSAAAIAHVVHQNLAHQFGRHGDKVCAVLGLRGTLANYAQIHLVNQRGTLQSMSGALIPQIVVRQVVEFLVDNGD